MDLAQIQILMVLSHPNKEFGFEPSNPNPWAQIHPIQTNQKWFVSGGLINFYKNSNGVVGWWSTTHHTWLHESCEWVGKVCHGLVK